MSMKAFSDLCHRYGPVEKTPNLSVSSTSPGISCTPTVVRYQEPSASQYRPQRFQKSGKRPAAPSSRSYRRRPRIREAPKRAYSCNICGKVYAQPQGVTRHQRETHQVRICVYCGDFKWGRPYQFRKHLKEQHPNVDPDTMLGSRRPTVSCRKVTIIPKHPPQQRVSPPTSENDRRGRVEPGLYPLAPPPSAVAEVTPLSPPLPPVVLSLDYDPQPEPAEPTNTTRMHGGFRELELLDAGGFVHGRACPMNERLGSCFSEWAN
jgi:hypothetical protein